MKSGGQNPLTATDDNILTRIADGDRDAVSECMDTYGSLVWSLARRWSDSAQDAEDASQEIFLEIWRAAHRYDPSRGSESVFIATIARRRMIDRLRARKRRPIHEEFDETIAGPQAQTSADDSMVGAEADIARRALETLKPEHRQMLLMGVVEGMSHAEIATATGKPLGTVKTQIRRGLIRVRELIEQGDDSKEGTG